MSRDERVLSAEHLATLQNILHEGSVQASRALGQWLGKPPLIETDSLIQVPIAEATRILGESEEPILFGAVQFTGLLNGEMILAFDEPSGRSLVDMLVGSSSDNLTNGGVDTWSELSRSAVIESTNIMCCAYLNTLSTQLADAAQSVSLIPTAPEFKEEYPQSLLQFALMGQAVARDHALITRSRFGFDGTALNWTLLFLPDAGSILKLGMRLEPRTGNA